MCRFLAASLTVVAALPAFCGPTPGKNVIVMVGDGMGFSQVEAGSLYRFGESRKQIYWGFDHYACTTYSDNNREGYNVDKAWEDFKYFLRVPTDSSAGATAISTGYKCPNARVGMDRHGQHLPHMLYDAEALGKSTGVLSTVRLTHATPASFVTYDVGRGNELDIAKKMLLQSPVDLIMAAGHPWYDNDGRQVGGLEPDRWATAQKYDYVGGLETWQQLLEGKAGGDADGDGTPDPWKVVDSVEGIKSLATAPQQGRVFALLPVDSTLQFNRSGDAMADAYAVPRTEGLPTMAEMAVAALGQLSQDPDGFFIMMEGGAIDWGGHGNKPGRMIEEQIDFDKAIEAVVEWVETHSSWDETMLFITADHETGYVTGPGSDPEWQPLVNNGKEKMPGLEYHTKSHTNQLVPLFAKGAGVEKLREYIHGTDKRRGDFVDNTDISKVVRAAWGVPIPVVPQPEEKAESEETRAE
jgi:alkaline phosphatase